MPLSDDLKKADFKPGSFWVLYDSVASAFDSVVIQDRHESTLEYPQPPRQCGLGVVQRVSCTLLQYHYTATATPSLVSPADQQFKIIMLEDNQVVLNGYPNSYPFPGGIDIYYNYDVTLNNYGSVSVTKFDSLFIFNRYFKRVEKTPYFNYKIFPNSYYYFNADAGFLKIEVRDSTNTLVSNKVLVRYAVLK